MPEYDKPDRPFRPQLWLPGSIAGGITVGPLLRLLQRLGGVLALLHGERLGGDVGLLGRGLLGGFTHLISLRLLWWLPAPIEGRP